MSVAGPLNLPAVLGISAAYWRGGIAALPGLDAARIPAWAELEGLRPLLAAAARQHLYAARGDVVRRDAALAPALAALASAGIEVLLHKGIAYAAFLYRNAELRWMDDADLLVRPRDFERAGEVLVACGYLRNRFWTDDNRWQHERAFLGRGLGIDLHRFIVQPLRHRIDIDELWSASRDVEYLGTTVRIACPEHRMILHCLNQAIHEFRTRAITWADLQGMLREGVDAARVAETARRWRVARAVSVSLAALARLEEGGVPADLLAAFVLSRSLRAFVARYVAVWGAPGREPRRSATYATRLGQLRLKFLFLDGPRERLSFLRYAATVRAVHAVRRIAGRRGDTRSPGARARRARIRDFAGPKSE